MVRRLLSLFVALVGISLLPLTRAMPEMSAIQAQTAERCFPETGFCIAGRIRDYWEQNGGLPVFGLPITPQQRESLEVQTPGQTERKVFKVFEVQWFERNRLELHPENSPPYDVLLGRLGEDTLKAQERDWDQVFPKSPASPTCRFFAETQHNICEPFLARWRASGIELDGVPGKTENENLALFGSPLSEQHVETIEGRQIMVQWFERARFEIHPENPPPNPDNVLLGLLGNELRQPTHYRIVFQTNRDSNTQIYEMNSAGKQPPLNSVTRLLSTQYLAEDPEWSPDGKWVAFDSYKDGNWEVYMMRRERGGDGGWTLWGDPVRLTNDDSVDTFPAWSTAGWIAFQSNREGGSRQIWVTKTDGTDLKKLFNSSVQAAQFPSWSPDGRKLVFQSRTDPTSNWALYTADFNPDTGQADTPVPLKANGTDLFGARPDWSPDGKRIAFQSTLDSADFDIYVVNVDGTGLSNLTPGLQDRDDQSPAWSPDSKQIAFQSRIAGREDAKWQIYVMQADGTNPVNLTGDETHLNDENPGWSPQVFVAPAAGSTTPAPTSTPAAATSTPTSAPAGATSTPTNAPATGGNSTPTHTPDTAQTMAAGANATAQAAQQTAAAAVAATSAAQTAAAVMPGEPIATATATPAAVP